MIKLYGLRISNYYNITKLALLEQGIPFEEIQTMPSKEPAVTAMSPMGKIPYIQDGDYVLSESQAILHYLDRIKPGLYPADAKAAGRAQQIHAMLDLYIDGTARQLLAAAFFGGTATPEQITAVSEQLEKNMKALGQVVNFSPFIAGDKLTHADLAAYAIFGFARAVMTQLKAPDPLKAIAGVDAYLEMLAKRPAFAQVSADQQAAFAAMFAKS